MTAPIPPWVSVSSTEATTWEPRPPCSEPSSRDLVRALRSGGICSAHAGSLIATAQIARSADSIAPSFPEVVLARATTPSSGGGDHRSFVATREGSGAGPDRAALADRLDQRGVASQLLHYTPAFHHASLVHPRTRPAVRGRRC